MSRSITFVVEGNVDTKVTVTELEDGTLRFDLMVLNTGAIGDLRALYFDMNDVDVTGLSSTGGDVTGTAYEEGAVNSLKSDTSIKGRVTKTLGDFDVGIAFGTPDTTPDDIQSTSFILDHDSVDLTLDMLDETDFGLRYTSVGEVGGKKRKDEAKIGDQSNGVADNDTLAVTENESSNVNLLTNDTNGGSNAVTGVVDGDGVAFTTTASGFEKTIMVDGLELGVLTVTADGVATFDANGADVDALEEGEQVGFAVTYTTTAPDGSLASADLDVTVTGTADITTPTTFGVTIKGFDDFGQSGFAVSSAGDINKDGIDDILIASFRAIPPGEFDFTGAAYVVYGGQDLDAEIDLATLGQPGGADGFTLTNVGVDNFDNSDFSLSSAGDVNGDGIDDIVVGSYYAQTNGVLDQRGVTYVIYGGQGFGTLEDLNSLGQVGGLEGFALTGVAADDWSGFTVSSAGDVNGDGINDILIGAREANPNGRSDAGEMYVVYGGQTFDAEIDLGTLGQPGAVQGFTIEGSVANDRIGLKTPSLGDVNDDGIDDIVVAGLDETYVIFGGQAFGAEVDLATLGQPGGVDGFGIDVRGTSVSAIGDVNGDGVDDILIGNSGADPDGKAFAGETYVIYGGQAFGSNVDLTTLGQPGGVDGFALAGIDERDSSGRSVSSAGDVNGDGIEDILIGASNADPDGVNDAGEVYLLFGGQAFDAEVDLSTLGQPGGPEGFVLKGIDEFDFSGGEVTSAGDVNGDGFDDILIAALGASPDGAFSAGESYIVYGGEDTFERADIADGVDDGVISLANLGLSPADYEIA